MPTLDCRQRIRYTEPMKKPSSLGVGLWVVGGVFGLYLLGGVAIWVDLLYLNGRFHSALPTSVQDTLTSIYLPFNAVFFPLLERLGII
jgi:hypothetical protein